jgi:hypothetical protein
MDMGTRETASRQNHQPLPAHLDVSAGISFEIMTCSGSKPSATDPLHPNSNEINVRSGVAERTPFFLEKSKAALLSSHTFTGSPRKPCFKFFAGACRERMPKDLELSRRNDPLADCQLLRADCFFVTAVTAA